MSGGHGRTVIRDDVDASGSPQPLFARHDSSLADEARARSAAGDRIDPPRWVGPQPAVESSLVLSSSAGTHTGGRPEDSIDLARAAKAKGGTLDQRSQTTSSPSTTRSDKAPSPLPSPPLGDAGGEGMVSETDAFAETHLPRARARETSGPRKRTSTSTSPVAECRPRRSCGPDRELHADLGQRCVALPASLPDPERAARAPRPMYTVPLT